MKMYTTGGGTLEADVWIQQYVFGTSMCTDVQSKQCHSHNIIYQSDKRPVRMTCVLQSAGEAILLYLDSQTLVFALMHIHEHHDEASRQLCRTLDTHTLNKFDFTPRM